MNKKALIILFFILFVIICSSIVFANFIAREEKVPEKLDLSGTVSMQGSYVKLSTKDINNEQYVKIANASLDDLPLTDKQFDLSNVNVSAYKDNVNSLTVIVLLNDDMKVSLNGETGELISYLKKNSKCPKNTLSESVIKNKALELFNNFTESNEYELSFLEPFDDELYIAKFFKKYGEFTNPGERITLSFSPETSEIISFSKTSVPFANNEVKITEDKASEIAIQYMDDSSATDMTVSLEIVTPNYGLNKPLMNTFLYKNSNQTRLAYVFRFNNDAKTEIYIDCTTGTTIGTNGILGGEF